MAYTKTNFKDRIDTKPTTYIVDGKPTIIEKDNSGLVQEGTPLNADTLNHLEDEISNNSIEIDNLNKNSVSTKDLEDLIGDEKNLKTTNKNNLVNAINETFQYGVEAKKNVVAALTSKDVKVTTDNTWKEIGHSIKNMKQGDYNVGDIINYSKLDIKEEPIARIYNKKCDDLQVLISLNIFVLKKNKIEIRDKCTGCLIKEFKINIPNRYCRIEVNSTDNFIVLVTENGVILYDSNGNKKTDFYCNIYDARNLENTNVLFPKTDHKDFSKQMIYYLDGKYLNKYTTLTTKTDHKELIWSVTLKHEYNTAKIGNDYIYVNSNGNLIQIFTIDGKEIANIDPQKQGVMLGVGSASLDKHAIQDDKYYFIAQEKKQCLGKITTCDYKGNIKQLEIKFENTYKNELCEYVNDVIYLKKTNENENDIYFLTQNTWGIIKNDICIVDLDNSGKPLKYNKDLYIIDGNVYKIYNNFTIKK